MRRDRGEAPAVRMSWADRSFLSQISGVAFGRLDLPPPDVLRESFRRLAAAAPDHLLFHRIERVPRPRWRRVPSRDLDAFCAAMVNEVSPSADLRDVSEASLLRPIDDLPFRVDHLGDRVGFTYSHAFGDAVLFNDLLVDLLLDAKEGRPARSIRPSTTRLPLLRALVHHYGRDPRRLVETIRLDRPSPPESPDGPAEAPGEPGVAIVGAASAVGVPDEIRQWRARCMPGVSVPAIVFAAVRRALAQAGVPLQWSGMNIVADVRRYLPPGARVDSNFVGGLYLDPADPFDPQCISQSLRAAIRAARPLAAFAMSTLKAGTSPDGGEPEVSVAGGAAKLAISYVGSVPQYDAFPWISPPGERTYLPSASPGAPDRLTISVTEFDQRLHVYAAPARSVLPVDLIDEALRAVSADPIGLARPETAVR